MDVLRGLLEFFLKIFIGIIIKIVGVLKMGFNVGVRTEMIFEFIVLFHYVV